MPFGLVQESRYVLGPILAVGIHYDNSIKVIGVRYLGKADGNCPLVAKITNQFDKSYRTKIIEVLIVDLFCARLFR